MRQRLLRQSVCLHSQLRPRKLCVDDESLDSLGWCALVPPLFFVPRIRVARIRVHSENIFNKSNADMWDTTILPKYNYLNCEISYVSLVYKDVN